MKYNVGQILYVILEKQQMVFPMQVIEEITKRTLLNSEIVMETDYLLRMEGKNPKNVYLSAIQGEIFDAAQTARNILVERATSSIDKHINSAVLKAQEWYGNVSTIHSNETDVHEDEDEVTYVDLGNGVKARVKI
jgi:hypothetical protein